MQQCNHTSDVFTYTYEIWRHEHHIEFPVLLPRVVSYRISIRAKRNDLKIRSRSIECREQWLEKKLMPNNEPERCWRNASLTNLQIFYRIHENEHSKNGGILFLFYNRRYRQDFSFWSNCEFESCPVDNYREAKLNEFEITVTFVIRNWEKGKWRRMYKWCIR